jgi:hypothetical protein
MQATISYVSAYTNGVATANASVTVPVAVDPTTTLLNLARSGGILFADAANVSTPGLLTWIPLLQITKVTFA